MPANDTLVRTRFAPSPTGYLHIGGARTALFNYLYARRYGGAFVLRIDDTDQTRNVELAVKPILDGLKWLGVHWDEGPVYQSQRGPRYRSVAEGLLKVGSVYPDEFGPVEDVKSRKAYRGRNRDLGAEQAFALYDDTGWSLRYKMPDEKVVLDDLVKGQIEFDTSKISDPVILRSGGDATYNFATVVDDAEMRITHVIRGEEHLSNTPVQLLLHHELGHAPPFYAHVPFVCEPGSTKKLSKREVGKFLTADVIAKLREIGFSGEEMISRDELNPATLTYYNVLGYKPGAVANYLARLGWSLDGETEIMTLPQMEAHFGLDRVADGPAQFDPKKMLWVAQEHTRQDDPYTKTTQCLNYLVQAKLIPPPAPDHFEDVQKVVQICGDRIKVYSDILTYGAFFFRDPVYSTSDVEKHLGHDMRPLLGELTELLAQLSPWQADALESRVKSYTEPRGLKPNKMIFALRVAITGNMVGPSLYHAMEFLGRDKCVQRCRKALTLDDIPF